MNAVKRKLTEDKLHRDSNCFLFLIISHGTADNFLLDRDGVVLSDGVLRADTTFSKCSTLNSDMSRHKQFGIAATKKWDIWLDTESPRVHN